MNAAFLFLVLTAASRSPSAYAAACCGGVASAPSLITSDDRAQVSLATSYGAVVGYSPSAGPAIFYGESSSDHTWVARIDVAHIAPESWSDRLQASVGASLVHRSATRSGVSQKNIALGDPYLAVSYELVPEYSYSVWRPRVFVGTRMTLPVGKSAMTTSDGLRTDVTGMGIPVWGVNVWVPKTWGNWDVLLAPGWDYYFAGTLQDVEVGSTWGMRVLVGGGWSWDRLRMGTRIQPSFRHTRELKSDFETRDDPQWVWDVGVDVSYLALDSLSVNFSFTDQTLLGPAKNSTLSRIFAVSLQYRIPR